MNPRQLTCLVMILTVLAVYSITEQDAFGFEIIDVWNLGERTSSVATSTTQNKIYSVHNGLIKENQYEKFVIVTQSDVRKKIQLPDIPSDITIDERNGLVYVSSHEKNRIFVIDAKTDRITKIFSLPAHPQHIEFDKHQNSLYIIATNNKATIPFSEFYVINTPSTNSKLCFQSDDLRGIAINYKKDVVYVTENKYNGIHIVDRQTCSKKGWIDVKDNPNQITVDQSSSTLYITTSNLVKQATKLIVVDEQNKIRKTLPIMNVGGWVGVDSKNKFVYVMSESEVAVMDANEEKIVWKFRGTVSNITDRGTIMLSGTAYVPMNNQIYLIGDKQQELKPSTPIKETPTTNKAEQERLDFERREQMLVEQVYAETLKAEQERQRLQDELRQKEYQSQQDRIRVEQERQRLQDELRQKEYQSQQEYQRLADQQRLENERNKIRMEANSVPLLKGLINGELKFYVEPLPSYASIDVRNNVELLATQMDGKVIHGVKLKRVYSTFADFTINWVKDYQEHAIGSQIGSHLIVGLGSNNCQGDWRSFNGYTVMKIMWHEVGHALGYGHTNDRNNIMYQITNTKYTYDVDSNITLPDGYSQTIYLCKSGHYYFTTETTSSTDGYKVYVIPSTSSSSGVLSGKDSLYSSCSAYENEMRSFSQNCIVEQGSAIVIYNPSTFGRGNAVQVNIKVYDMNQDYEPDFTLPSSSMYFSQEYMNYVRALFR